MKFNHTKQIAHSKTFFSLIKEIYDRLLLSDNIDVNVSDMINPIVILSILNIFKGKTAIIRDQLAIEYFSTSNYSINILNIIITSIKQHNDMILVCNSQLCPLLLSQCL